jgi:group I intron endonuclease
VNAQRGCVYLLTNAISGRRYVGKCGNEAAVEVRWNVHIRLAFNKKDRRPLYCAIRKAWKRDGCLKNFTAEVIWRGSLKNLDAKEIHYIAKLHTWIDDPLGDRSYNLTKGGDGLTKPSKLTVKKMSASQLRRFQNVTEREKLSAAHFGLKYGPQTAEHRARISAGNKGRKHTAASRANMSAAHIGKKPAHNGTLGMKFSEKTRHKMCVAQRARRRREAAENVI